MRTFLNSSVTLRTNKWYDVSKDRDMISVFYDFSGNIVDSYSRAAQEGFLVYWSNLSVAGAEGEIETIFSNYPALRSYSYGSYRYLQDLTYGSPNDNKGYIPLGDEI